MLYTNKRYEPGSKGSQGICVRHHHVQAMIEQARVQHVNRREAGSRILAQLALGAALGHGLGTTQHGARVESEQTQR